MNKLAIDIKTNFLGSSSNNLSEASGVSVYVQNIITASVSIAGIILLFMLIGGGIAMIAGAGKNDPKTVGQGKAAATSALIGFVVIFFAYWIVRLVETITGLELIS
ncbi:MAG: hypothetical protein AAB778_01240 [Patescibacteria group bacterium]